MGARVSPGGVGSTNHQGIDIGAAYGTNILAAKSGTVILAGWYGGYGNCVIIQHGSGGYYTTYGHMSRILVYEGQEVSQGQVIGLVGNTGASWGAHIHFEIHEAGVLKNPLDYLTGWYADMLHREKQPHRNVNTVAPVLALTCLYDETKNPEYLPVIESWIDWVMKDMPRTEYGGLQHCTVWNKHYQQLWCDTLFMVCLFLAKAGMVLNRPELIEEAEYQFLMHIRYLQNKVNGLFYHGWTFDRRHNFAEAFWARGNAWFTAAAVELYDITKRENAAMRMIKSAWQDQALALWKYQRVNGLYTTLINIEECYCETSATAAIAYGILKGVRLGWLPQEQYAQMGLLSANAVLDQIDETGAVQGVSGGTGMGHDLEHYKKIIVTPTAYGQGLTFLMLTELMNEEYWS